MSKRTAAIIGSTGMIGSYLLEQLMADDYYNNVRILVRRPILITSDRLEVKLVNFDDLESVQMALDGTDIIFSCIGTTNKNVRGDKKLYWKIDHDIPVNAARLALERGCNKMVMVSSVGADPNSRNFYLKLKGQTEKDVVATGMQAVHVMRPGMLLGKRKEKRPLEKLMQGIMGSISGVMIGKARKFKAIHGADVAKAMIAAGKRNVNGLYIYEHDEMIGLSEDH